MGMLQQKLHDKEILEVGTKGSLSRCFKAGLLLRTLAEDCKVLHLTGDSMILTQNIGVVAVQAQ